MSSNRKYYGQTYVDKCYRGAKSVNLRLVAGEASILAEKLLKAVNAGRKRIDVAVYATDNTAMQSGQKARITVTSDE